MQTQLQQHGRAEPNRTLLLRKPQIPRVHDLPDLQSLLLRLEGVLLQLMLLGDPGGPLPFNAILPRLHLPPTQIIHPCLSLALCSQVPAAAKPECGTEWQDEAGGGVWSVRLAGCKSPTERAQWRKWGRLKNSTAKMQAVNGGSLQHHKMTSISLCCAVNQRTFETLYRGRIRERA